MAGRTDARCDPGDVQGSRRRPPRSARARFRSEVGRTPADGAVPRRRRGACSGRPSPTGPCGPSAAPCGRHGTCRSRPGTVRPRARSERSRGRRAGYGRGSRPGGRGAVRFRAEPRRRPGPRAGSDPGVVAARPRIRGGSTSPSLRSGRSGRSRHLARGPAPPVGGPRGDGGRHVPVDPGGGGPPSATGRAAPRLVGGLRCRGTRATDRSCLSLAPGRSPRPSPAACPAGSFAGLGRSPLPPGRARPARDGTGPRHGAPGPRGRSRCPRRGVPRPGRTPTKVAGRRALGRRNEGRTGRSRRRRRSDRPGVGRRGDGAFRARKQGGPAGGGARGDATGRGDERVGCGELRRAHRLSRGAQGRKSGLAAQTGHRRGRPRSAHGVGGPAGVHRDSCGRWRAGPPPRGSTASSWPR